MPEVKPLLFCIPPEKLPDCWNDESRINVLFAPFRTRNANPQDWDSKLAFWRKMIGLYCEYSKTYTFTISELLKVFNRKGRSPGCLEDVITEMVKLKEVQAASEFLETPSRSWVGWTAHVFLKKPITWTFNTVKNTFIKNDKNTEYIHLTSIDHAEKEFINSFPEELTDRVLNLQKLIEIIDWPKDKVNSLQLILHKMLWDGKADIRELNINSKDPAQNLHCQLVKIGSGTKTKPIADIDISTYILEENEKLLMKTVLKEEAEINKIREEAKSYLQKNHRQMAKLSLIKKRELEKGLVKKASALHNIQILLSNVKDVKTDAEVLSSYKLALSTLQNSFKEKGLTEDAVTETMISLGEILDTHEDIQSSLAQPVDNDNMEELEQELAELIANKDKMGEGNVKEEEEEAIPDLEKQLEALRLPNVPATNPSAAKTKISL